MNVQTSDIMNTLNILMTIDVKNSHYVIVASVVDDDDIFLPDIMWFALGFITNTLMTIMRRMCMTIVL